MLSQLGSYETASKINMKVIDLKYILKNPPLNLTSKAHNSLSCNGEFMMLKNLFPIPSSLRDTERDRQRRKQKYFLS